MHNLSNFDIIDVESVCAPYYSDRRKGCSVSVFAGLLRSIRKSSKISQRNLGLGLCSVSEISRIENGEREAGFLLQSALLSRLGFSSGSYFSYVYRDEYDRYKERKNIIKAIEEEQYDEAIKAIERYKADRFKAHNKTGSSTLNMELQFCEAMYIQILRARGASESTIHHYCLSAMNMSMSHLLDIEGLTKDMLLTFQEIDILLEYRHTIAMCSDMIKDFSRVYTELYEWVCEKGIDYAVIAVLLSKIAVYYARYLKKKGLIKAHVTDLADIEIDAIEALRKGQKGFYLCELNDDIQELNRSFPGLFDNRLDVSLIAETADIIRTFYREYNKDAYNSNSLVLFHEKRILFIGDVISRRRKTLGLTKEKLCDDICDIRVLNGLISGRKETQSPIIKDILKRLDLVPDLVNFGIKCENGPVLRMFRDISLHLTNGEYEKCRELLEKVKKSIYLNIKQNRQAIHYYQSVVKHHKKEITDNEYLQELTDILSYTCSIQTLIKADDIFLSKWELSCLMKISLYSEQESVRLIPVLSKYVDTIEKNNEEKTQFGIYTFASEALYRYYCENDELNKAAACADRLIKVGLSLSELKYLSFSKYKVLRIEYLRNKLPDSLDKIRKQCFAWIKICEFCYDDAGRSFFGKILKSH